jgi:hypothetical protein
MTLLVRTRIHYTKWMIRTALIAMAGETVAFLFARGEVPLW